MWVCEQVPHGAEMSPGVQCGWARRRSGSPGAPRRRSGVGSSTRSDRCQEKKVPALGGRRADSPKSFRLLRGRSRIEMNTDLMGHESTTPGVGRAGFGTHAGASTQMWEGLHQPLASLVKFIVAGGGTRLTPLTPHSLFPFPSL